MIIEHPTMVSSALDDTLQGADPARSRRFGLEPEYRGPRDESLQGQKLRDGAFVGPRLGEVVQYSPVTVTWMVLVRTCKLDRDHVVVR